MTNAEIIFAEEQRLAEAGKIKYTGRTFEIVNGKGEKATVKETEEIHTYQAWKELGYQVQKGQKAISKLTIWKHSGAKMESLAEAMDRGRMFMKTAHFFSRSQVEAVPAE